MDTMTEMTTISSTAPDDSKKIEADPNNKRLKYPRSIFFIIGNEFCERFSYFGMKTISALYTSAVLGYSDDTSTELFHLHNMMCYFFPLVGAAIADSYIGKYKTILYASIIYTFGNLILSAASATVLQLPQRSVSLFGMFIMAIGTGGIKPCVGPFGGDQFIIPGQEIQLQRYFSAFYFTVNAGALLSTIITPILREDIHCLGEDTCFPLAFGVPALFMVTAITIFIIGTPMYVTKNPEGNITVASVKCISRAVKNKFWRNVEMEKKDHWLEYAEDKYDKKLIKDIKDALNVLIMFLPVPLYWTLYDQTGSTWVFQATRMDGRFYGYIIKPDQMHLINPLLIMILIPIFETYVHPNLYKIGIKRPLQKMTIGGFLVAVCYIICAVLEMNIEKSDPILPGKHNGQLRIFNTLNCDISMKTNNLSFLENIPVISSSTQQLIHIPVEGAEIYITSVVDYNCFENFTSWNGDIKVTEGQSTSYAIYESYNKKISIQRAVDFDDLHKDINALAKIRIFYRSTSKESTTISTKFVKNGNLVREVDVVSNQFSNFTKITPARYDVFANNISILKDVNFEPGVVLTLIIRANNNRNNFSANVVQMVPSNHVHILWQLPQFFVITIGEIFFAVTGLEFSFTQAPESMKSVILAAWVLMTTIGNFFIIILSEFKFFTSEALQYLMYSILMFVNMIIFAIMAFNYKYMVQNK